MGRSKFFVGIALIVVAVVYLIASSTAQAVEYFMTVDELKAQGASMIDKNLRASGAVIGDSIRYDPATLTLTFEVAQVPGDNAEIDALGGLAAVLHQAVIDPTRARMTVVYVGVQPDLLRNEAQAIMTGHLGEDGIFYADELLLKCPTKYEEAVPEQSASQ